MQKSWPKMWLWWSVIVHLWVYNSITASASLWSAHQERRSWVESDAAVLLGAPLSTGEALTLFLEARCEELSIAIERLGMVDKHDALILLRCSMSSPKLLYTLRCCPSVDKPLLDRYDVLLRKGLSSILNIDMTNDQWTQASLPIKLGGLGIRRAASLAIPAFLASAAGTQMIQASMLGNIFTDTDGVTLSLRWSEESQSPIPEGNCARKQSQWDGPSYPEGSFDFSG